MTHARTHTHKTHTHNTHTTHTHITHLQEPLEGGEHGPPVPREAIRRQPVRVCVFCVCVCVCVCVSEKRVLRVYACMLRVFQTTSRAVRDATATHSWPARTHARTHTYRLMSRRRRPWDRHWVPDQSKACVSTACRVNHPAAMPIRFAPDFVCLFVCGRGLSVSVSVSGWKRECVREGELEELLTGTVYLPD